MTDNERTDMHNKRRLFTPPFTTMAAWISILAAILSAVTGIMLYRKDSPPAAPGQDSSAETARQAAPLPATGGKDTPPFQTITTPLPPPTSTFATKSPVSIAPPAEISSHESVPHPEPAPLAVTRTPSEVTNQPVVPPPKKGQPAKNSKKKAKKSPADPNQKPTLPQQGTAPSPR